MTDIARIAKSGNDRYFYGLHWAHCPWGLLTRSGAKIAASNVGILFSRHFNCPDLAFASLVVEAKGRVPMRQAFRTSATRTQVASFVVTIQP